MLQSGTDEHRFYLLFADGEGGGESYTFSVLHTYLRERTVPDGREAQNVLLSR